MPENANTLFPDDKSVTVAFTGYRPEKIRISSSGREVEGAIRSSLRHMVELLYDKGVRIFLSGMAEGFDIWAAEEVLLLRSEGRCPKARLIAVIPYKGQERGYDADYISRYNAIMLQCGDSVTLSERYHVNCFFYRNDFLVNNSSIVVCYYDGQKGGTAYTVRAARRAGIPVINLFDGEIPMFI